MQKKLFLILALATFVTSTSFAAEIKGVCKLEGNSETFKLRERNRNESYGVFAEGISTKGDIVRLAAYHHNEIYADVHAPGGQTGYSVIPVSANSAPTTVRFGLFVYPSRTKGERTKAEWISCNLIVTP